MNYELMLQMESEIQMCRGVLNALMTHGDLDAMPNTDIQACLMLVDERVGAIMEKIKEVAIG